MSKKFSKICSLILVISISFMLIVSCGSKNTNTIKIGAQNYAEVITMAYMAEALIEDNTDYEVEVVSRLASVIVLDQALKTGDVDIGSLMFTGGAGGLLHPEIIKKIENINDSKWKNPEVVFDFIQEHSIKELNRKWISPLGYENTYAIIVRREFAEKNNLKTISDLKGLSSNLIIGMDDAYLDREIDGYYPLIKNYSLEPFNKTVSMQINLLYQAIKDKQVDVGVAYSTDARIHSFDLVWLEDDMNFYPPFEAAYVVNESLLEKAPDVEEILSRLSGQIDIDTIRKLNYEVDINHRDHKEVALEYLKENGFLQ